MTTTKKKNGTRETVRAIRGPDVDPVKEQIRTERRAALVRGARRAKSAGSAMRITEWARQYKVNTTEVREILDAAGLSDAIAKHGEVF